MGIAAIMVLLTGVTADTPTPAFTVVNKCTPTFTVVNRVPAKPTAPAAPTGYRQPHGHTHTCSAGHSWDHDSNPTHTCQVCGLPQNVVDSTPKMIQTTTATYTIPLTLTGTPGCVNGNCPAPTTYQRRGLFR